MSSSSQTLAHLHFALISRKRGRLREKHAKGTQAGILHRVQLVIATPAHVRKLLRTLPQPGHKPLEHGLPPTSDPGSRLWCTRFHTRQLLNQFQIEGCCRISNPIDAPTRICYNTRNRLRNRFCNLLQQNKLWITGKMRAMGGSAPA